MILIPDLMPFDVKTDVGLQRLLQWTTAKKQFGAVVLTPSDKSAQRWAEIATVAQGSEKVEKLVTQLQSGDTCGPVVFANRYDGMDLPGDSCRLLILHGLPTGTSNYELFRAACLYGGSTILRMLAQRIEQGIGRGARGSGDHCVVILAGADLAGWVSKEANFQLLTNATRAQLEMGIEVSKEVSGLQELAETVNRSYSRDSDWTEYHAAALAESLDEKDAASKEFDSVAAERKACNLWQDGQSKKAIAVIEKAVSDGKVSDKQTQGWLEQLAARISDHWENHAHAEALQQNAYANNRNLLRPKVAPPYKALVIPDSQSRAMAEQFRGYRIRRGRLKMLSPTCMVTLPLTSSKQPL